jgi:hypothetical protein
MGFHPIKMTPTRDLFAFLQSQGQPGTPPLRRANPASLG